MWFPFGIFSGEFGTTFNEMHTFTKLPTSIKDLSAAGGTGVLEWEDGVPHIPAAQWIRLDQALTI